MKLRLAPTNGRLRSKLLKSQAVVAPATWYGKYVLVPLMGLLRL